MQTVAFSESLTRCMAFANDERVALMCAEAVPWRCHRSLVADAVTARGAHVEHITGVSRSISHRMTSFAQVQGTCVTYPGQAGDPGPIPSGTEAGVLRGGHKDK
jgi:uncharacterized protein (DUF488 family)